MSPKRSGKILVVEDEQGVRSILREYLSIEGYQVEVAENGEEALFKLDKFLPDCILLDIRMPYLSGVDALKMIKFRIPAVRVIMTTAVSKDSTIQECIDHGAFAYIQKPIDLDLLSIKIWEALEDRAPALEAAAKADDVEIQAIVPKPAPPRKDKSAAPPKPGADAAEYKAQVRFLAQELYDTLKMSLALFEFSDPPFVHHSKNVSWLTRAIGLELGYPQTRLLEMAGLFHDVGKLRLPERLRHSRYEDLSEIEKKVYEKYPVWSQEFVRQFTHLNNVGEALRGQRENLDGSGFPDQLAGEEINLASRILRAANDFDEAVHGKTPGNLEIDLARRDSGALLDPLRGQVNTWYDPLVIQALERVVECCRANPKQEIEIFVQELKPNQILSRDLVTESGRPVLPRDTILTPLKIHQIHEINEVDLIRSPFVYQIP